MALDLGSRRVGVAVCDPQGILATPHSVLNRSADPAADRRALAALVAELGVERVIIGLPLSLDGTEGPAAQAARVEAEALAPILGVPVDYCDERLSTVSAHRSMAAAGRNSRQRRRDIDSMAASVILQFWLDGAARRGEPE